MKPTTVLLILSSSLLVVHCDPIPGFLDIFNPSGAIVPDKTDLELIDHVAVANGPPTTTESPVSLNESTSTEPSSSESSKKDSEIKSDDLFDTSSPSSTSERPTSMEESSGTDHAQSDHHESSDATTALPTTTVLPTTNQELKDSPALSREEPLATLPSFETGSSSESALSSSEPAQSSSEASPSWELSSEDPAVNELDSDMDKKEADRDGDWFRLFGTDRQQEDFNNEKTQFDSTDASSIPSSSSTTEEPNKKAKDEMPLNDEKPKQEPPKVNVAGHGSGAASVSKGFNLIAVVASVLFLFTISH